jgi:hypothetical protein
MGFGNGCLTVFRLNWRYDLTADRPGLTSRRRPIREVPDIMLMTTPALSEVVRASEKKARLEAFVLQQLPALAMSHGHGFPVAARVVARSFDSPVIQVLEAIEARTDVTGGLRLDVLIAAAVSPANAEANDRPLYRQVARNGGAILVGSDPRLLEAHEYLILGETGLWIGDCMRRDPAVRDAFEAYGPFSGHALTLAQRSFDRLWRVAGRSGEAVVLRHATTEPSLRAASLTAHVADASESALVLTRH